MTLYSKVKQEEKIESENAVELAAYVQRFNFVKSVAHCAAHLTAARQRFKSAVIFSGSGFITEEHAVRSAARAL